MTQELKTIALLGGGILALGFTLLGMADNWLLAGQWLIQAGLIWGFVVHHTWQRLSLNRASANEPLYSHLGWGNRLTILRGGLIALSGGFLFLTHDAWLAAVFYTLAAILDRFDGFIARRSQQVSLLGNDLDISFDALGLLIAPLLAIGLGKVHWSYLLLSLAYYIYQWALQRRRHQNLVVYDLPENPLRRTLAGFQMGFIAVALWPWLHPDLSTIASIAFMLPVLFGFIVDWWIVSGRLQAQVISGLQHFSEAWFLPGLRILTLLLLFSVWQHTDSSGLTALMLILNASLILLGLAGRLGALLLMLWLSQNFQSTAVTVSDAVLVLSISWILLLGTGRYSLRKWGEDWLTRYDGA